LWQRLLKFREGIEMSEEAQRSDTPPSPKLPLNERVVLFFREPLVSLGLLAASVLAAIVGTVAVFAHPVYNASPAILLYNGQTQAVWSAETPTPGNGTTAASQQVQLMSGKGDGATPFSVDGKFSGAPGAFEVDVQVTASDADTNYQTCSNCNITTVDATNNTFHLDFVGSAVRYVRLLLRSRTNSVSITATISR
jgi:hypothetical protein